MPRKSMKTSSKKGSKFVKFAKKAHSYAKKYVPKGTATKVGGYFGGPAGAIAGKQFARLTGVGDYTMHGGDIMNNQISPAPRFSQSDADIIISKCEYICDIYSGNGAPSPFTEQIFAVQPGLNVIQGGAFNWLSNIASAWQQYEFLQLVFEYRPTSGNATGTNTSLGQVVMACSYQPSTLQANNGFGSKQAMLDTQWSITGPPSSMLLLPVECKKTEQNFKFHSTRSSQLRSNQNIDIFDLAGLSVATVGCQTANQSLGELYVSYTIRLKATQTDATGGVYGSHYTVPNNYAVGNITTSHIFGTGSYPLIANPGSNLPMVFDYANNIIKFPTLLNSGTFMITMIWVGDPTIVNSPYPIAFSNCILLDCFMNPTLSSPISYMSVPLTSDTVLGSFNTYVIQVTGANAYFLMGWSTGAILPANCVNFDMTINLVNNQIYQALP